MEFEFLGIDGNKYTFKTEVNPLVSNIHMWTINDWHTCYASSKRELNSVIQTIKKNCEIL